MKKSTIRILIGLLAVVLIDQIGGRVIYSGLAPDGGDSVRNLQENAVRMWAISGLLVFFATAVGGFIAREKFLIPAIAYVGVYLAYGWFVTLSSLAASGQLHLEMVPYLLLPGLIDVPVGAAGAFAGMKLFGLIGARRAEMHVDQSPVWLKSYRYYLYFALILSAVGMLLSFTIFGGSFRFAVVNIAVAIFVISSLQRFGEKRITIVHLVVNAATLAAASASMGIGIYFSEVFMAPLSLLGVDFGALNLLARELAYFYDWSFENLAVVSIALAFVLLSVYWLWKLYQFMQSPEGSRPIGDSDIKSWKKGRKVLYITTPLLVSALVATVIVFAPVLLAEATGAGAFMIYAAMLMPLGNEMIFVGAVMSVYRICKIVI
jgi:hypothetical protein